MNDGMFPPRLAGGVTDFKTTPLPERDFGEARGMPDGEDEVLGGEAIAGEVARSCSTSSGDSKGLIEAEVVSDSGGVKVIVIPPRSCPNTPAQALLSSPRSSTPSSSSTTTSSWVGVVASTPTLDGMKKGESSVSSKAAPKPRENMDLLASSEKASSSGWEGSTLLKHPKKRSTSSFASASSGVTTTFLGNVHVLDKEDLGACA
jgi:hypothetical protein